MPAVSLRQPSLDFQMARRTTVFIRKPKSRIFNPVEASAERGALAEVVFTSQHKLRTRMSGYTNPSISMPESGMF